MSTDRRDDPDEALIEALLREAGARDAPPAGAADEIEYAVRAEWRAMVEQRRRSRRVFGFAAAASAVLAVLLGLFAVRGVQDESTALAALAHVSGRLEAADETSRSVFTKAANQPLVSGMRLATDADSYAALAYGGLAVRMDRETRIILSEPGRIELLAGALYVDAPDDARDDALVIDTSAGAVTHLGTQYQVRQHDGAVRIAVREGRIELQSVDAVHTASAGEQLLASAAGAVERRALPTIDASWSWTAAAAPPFAIEEQPLAAFLEWAARETGREVLYSSADARRTAEQTQLRGSIAGLAPDEALEAVLATTTLRREASPADAITIGLAAEE